MLGAPLSLLSADVQEGGGGVHGRTAHFSWSSPEDQIGRTRPLIETVEKELSEITSWLGLPEAPQGKLLWITSREELNEALGFKAPSWYAAVTQPSENRIIMVIHAAHSQEQLHKTLRHELVHWAMQSLGEKAWAAQPAWVHEGIAEVWAEQRLLSGMQVSLSWPAFRNELPYLGDFDTGFGEDPYVAAQGYAMAHAFFARLERIYGRDLVAQLMQKIRLGNSLDRALIDLTEEGLIDHEQALRMELGSLSRLLSDFYPQFFLLVTLLLTLGFPLAMRRRRSKHQALAKKWEEEDQRLDEVDGDRDDMWRNIS
ncbi:MAG: hypothetical protein O3A95_03945 [Planctomycetota bacterium]|nr:hypothetical protein [Planctomycetota bacterium]MDA1113435.1 hypothetical protein [Planctomycetota bacterium]